MLRTLAVLVSAVALAVASPSWALGRAPNQQQAGTGADATSGGPASALMLTGAPVTPSAGEQFVTGTVVMTTPSEIVIHTDQGMQRFALGPQMAENALPAAGDTVTLGYVPAGGGARVETITPAGQGASAQGDSQEPATEAEQPSAAMRGGQEPQTPLSETTPETTPASPPEMGSQTQPEQPVTVQHAARLPKTASNRPLILMLGLVALGAAGVLRLAVRS